MHPKDRIIVALDVPTLEAAENLVVTLAPYVGAFKVGLELLTAAGPDAARMVRFHGGQVMYDAKFHDIPNTMAGAAKSVARLGVKMFTMHASATREGMAAAVKESGMSLTLAVTVLTSMSDEDSQHVFGSGAAAKVATFAADALRAGADGIVCSPKEIALIRGNADLGNLLLVVPGIRPAWAQAADQKRTMTPGEAVAAGADYLVIGRPITAPPKEIGDPERAAQMIVQEIEKGIGVDG